MHKLLLLLLPIWLSACATMNGDECRAPAAIGNKDGREGWPGWRFEQHRDSCRHAGVALDEAAYHAAYAQGLRLYCSESTGYREGYLGYAYFGVCEGEGERAFLKGMEAGLRARFVEGYGDCPGGIWRNPHAWCPHWFER